MEGEKTVSVVLPVYNRAHLIEGVLESLLAQSRPPDEIIVVDDCSSDDPSFIQERDPRIRYFRLEKNQGAAGARNFGASQATGHYLAFLDSDDYWYPTKLEKQLALFESSSVPNLAVVFGEFDRQERNGRKRHIKRSHRGDLKEAFFKCGNVVGNFTNFIVLRAVFDSVGGLDLRMVPKEDYDFFIRLSLKGYQFDFVEEALFLKVQGDGEQITRRPRLVIHGNLRFYGRYKQYVAGRNNSMIVPCLVGVYAALKAMGRQKQASTVFCSIFCRFPPWRHPIQWTSYLRLFYYLIRRQR